MLRIIDKAIEKYIINILCTTLFILLSFSLWNSFENTSYASVAKYYDNYINSGVNIEYLKNYHDNINNKYIVKVKINNNNSNAFKYILLFRLNKDSSLDTNNIVIEVNNNILYLEEIRYDYSVDYDYYVLDINKVLNNKTYNIELTVSEKDKEKDLNYNLVIVEK